MKKKILVVMAILSVFGAGILVEKLLLSNNNIEDGFNDLSQVKHEHMLSMMLEQNAGAGDYELETRSSWPTKDDGYVFNPTLSKCEKGSKLRWDEENNMVVMVGTTSDKCYVYFDIFTLTTLTDYVKSQYTGTQGENNLYYHDSSLTNGAGDSSYRYAGAHDDVNNFVCFGSDAEICPDDNLYRIIGVFEDNVKLIKWDYATSTLLGTDGDYCMDYATQMSSNGWTAGTNKGTNLQSAIGAYWWNNDGTEYGTNVWSESKLNTTNLNKNYISYLNNQNERWEKMIIAKTWEIGGNTYANIVNTTVSNVYKNEIINPATSTLYNAKIGLMYVSDYGYAAAPSSWTTNLNSYSNVTNNNWMYMGLWEWTFTHVSNDTTLAFRIYFAGNVLNDSVGNSISAWAVRPVFYLNSNVIKIGDNIGSRNDPIRLIDGQF